MRKEGKGGKWKRQTDVIMASSSFGIARFPFSHFPSSYTLLQVAEQLLSF